MLINKINYKVFSYLMLLIVASLFIGSCSSVNGWVGSKLGLDTDLSLSIDVDSDINPDDRKKASPLFIRLYELKSAKLFNNADFISLYERDKEVLGADFIAKQELKRILPGKNRVDHFVLNKDTQIIALFAEFLDFKTSKYKIITNITANNVVSSSISIKVSGNKITLLELPTDVHDEDSGVYEDESKSGY